MRLSGNDVSPPKHMDYALQMLLSLSPQGVWCIPGASLLTWGMQTQAQCPVLPPSSSVPWRAVFATPQGPQILPSV